MKTVTVKLREEILEELDEIARRENLPRSTIVKKAIIEYIASYNKKRSIEPRIVKIYA